MAGCGVFGKGDSFPVCLMSFFFTTALLYQRRKLRSLAQPHRPEFLAACTPVTCIIAGITLVSQITRFFASLPLYRPDQVFLRQIIPVFRQPNLGGQLLERFNIHRVSPFPYMQVINAPIQPAAGFARGCSDTPGYPGMRDAGHRPCCEPN